jgi:hypothetical protein
LVWPSTNCQLPNCLFFQRSSFSGAHWPQHFALYRILFAFVKGKMTALWWKNGP